MNYGYLEKVKALNDTVSVRGGDRYTNIHTDSGSLPGSSSTHTKGSL